MFGKKLGKTLAITLGISTFANVLPTAIVSTIAYASTSTSDSNDVGDKKKFAKAKEKALEFIFKYNFTANMKWRDFTNALTDELSSEGITDTGDVASIQIRGNKGIASGTIYLYMDDEEYSFPFSVTFSTEKNADGTSKGSYVEDVNKAKEKALEFISKYNFTSNMQWPDFSKALSKELSDYGVVSAGDTANIDRDSGVVSGTITLYFVDKEETFPFTAQASDIKIVGDAERENVKEKTLQFIATYNFTSNTNWDAFNRALLKELTGSENGTSESGITGAGDVASIDKNTGVVSGTITIHLNGKDETFPFTAQASDINNPEGSNAKWSKNADGTWSLIINGSLATGWHQVSGKWYHLNPNGIMQTGWFKDTDGNWYFLKSNGDMACNEKIGGYYVNIHGVWVG